MNAHNASIFYDFNGVNNDTTFFYFLRLLIALSDLDTISFNFMINLQIIKNFS